MGRLNGERFSSTSVERETPQALFDKLNNEFHFTLDPCATLENTKCSKYYTKEQDGLKQDWSGDIVYCNPPYGKEMTKWIKKSIEESKKGAICVVLIPARTNTNWWHDLCMKATEIRFLRGRPKFGNMKHGLPFPLALLIFSSHTQELKIGTFDVRCLDP